MNQPPIFGFSDVSEQRNPNANTDADVTGVTDVTEIEGARGARHLIAVGGGRGGVGKSLIAQNLAVYFAQLGKRVALIDSDATGTNIHTQFGLAAGAKAFPIDGGPTELAKALLATSIPGLSLLPSPHDAVDPPMQLRAGRKSRWLARVRSLPVDYLVIDVGPGHGPLALDVMLAADFSICVTIPEPPAIEATYRFLRAAYRRRLRRALGRDRFRLSIVDRAMNEIGRLPSPRELVTVLSKADKSIAQLAWAEAQRINFFLAVNQTRVRTDAELASSMTALCKRHYGITLEELGWIENDDTVWLAVRRRKPLLIDSPTSKAARNLERIARRIAALSATKKPYREAPSLIPQGVPDHYASLGIGRSSNDEEIRRAAKRQRDVYAAGSLATTSLLDEAALSDAVARIDEAHDTLLDPIRRRAYDLSTFPDIAQPSLAGPVPKPALAAEQLMLQSELAREIGPETEFSGELLRKVRESQGIELSEISARTKISRAHLHAIEEEIVEQLPATVYVRGFLSELAKYLRLDPTHVQRSYLRRMREKNATP